MTKASEIAERLYIISHGPKNVKTLTACIMRFLDIQETSDVLSPPLCGSSIPIDNKIIRQLSFNSRVDLMLSLEASFLNAKPTTCYNYGVIETYASLVENLGQMHPSFLTNFATFRKLQTNLGILNNLLELINFRLPQYFSQIPKICAHLVSQLARLFEIESHSSLLLGNLEISYLNLMYWMDPEEFFQHEIFSKLDLKPRLNQHLPFCLSRIVKQKGFVNKEKLLRLLNHFWTLRPSKFSAETYQFFPPILQDFYQTKVTAPPQYTLITELNKDRKYLYHIEKNYQPLLEFYQNTTSRKYFFAKIWLVAFNTSSFEVEALSTAARIISSWSFKEKESAVYILVESMLSGEKKPDNWNQSANMLALCVWRYKLFDFETLIMAFLDHPQLQFLFPLLNLLLITTPDFLERVQSFEKLDISLNNPDMQLYFDKFPEAPDT